MRRASKIIILLIIVLLASAAVLPLLVPMESIKGVVQARLEAATGRKVTMDSITLSVFPTIALKSSNVRIANPVWVGGGDMVSIKSLRLGVQLMPLLREEVHIKELTLEEPLFILIRQEGKESWVFNNNEASPAAAKKSNSGKENGLSIVRTLSLGTITIKNGGLIYKDADKGSVQDFSDVNIRIKAPDPSRAITLDGSILYNGKKIDIALSQANPLSALSGTPADANVKVAYGPLAFGWQGTFALKNAVPAFTGKVTVDTFDVGALTQKKEKTVASSEPSPGTGGRWSDVALPFTALNAVNADLDVQIGKIIMPKTTLENSVVHLRLQNGALQGTVNPVAAYGGTLKTEFGATSSGSAAFSADADHVNAEGLLHDLADTDTVAGMLNGHIALTATGVSQKDMIANLAGSGNFLFKDGKFKGKNFIAMAQNISSAFDGKDADTVFSALSGTFTIAKGIASNKDLKMESPLFHATGAGQADLPRWQVQYVLTPAVMGGSIAVPIRIDGALDNPHYQPDVAAAIKNNLKDPAKIKEGLKGIRKNLLNNDAVNGLLR